VPEWKVVAAEPQPTSPSAMPTWVRTAVIAGAAGGAALLLGGLAVCWLCAACKRRREKKRHTALQQADDEWPDEAGSGGPARVYAGYGGDRRPAGKQHQGRRERESRDRPQRQKPAVNSRRTWVGTAEDRGRCGRDWEGSYSPGSPGDERRRYRAEQEGRRKGSKHSSREYARPPSKEPAPWGGAASPREPGAGFFDEVSHEGRGAPHLLIPAGRTNSGMDGPSRWDGGSPGGPSPIGSPYREYGRGEGYAGMAMRSSQLPGPYPDGDGDEGWLPGTPRGHP
jgi:hypothetical protein